MKNLIVILILFVSSIAIARGTINLKHSDGKIFFSMDINGDKSEADLWIKNATTQGEIKKGDTAEFIDKGPMPTPAPVPTPDPVKIANRAARVISLQTALDNWTLLSTVEQKAVMKSAVEQLLDK